MHRSVLYLGPRSFLSESPVAVFSPRYLLWATVWAAGGSSPPVLSRGVLARPRDRSVPGATAWRGRSVVDSCDSQSALRQAYGVYLFRRR